MQALVSNSSIAPAPVVRSSTAFVCDNVTLYNADVTSLYEKWQSPVVIVSDGAYGVAGFAGDPPAAEALPEWYEPHIKAWSAKATPLTTLWFWNTEIGWANVHPILVKYGWTYRNCHIWDKGISHIAGNANSKSLRKFPVVTEVCVQYVRDAEFRVNGQRATMQQWLRAEWLRSGLPLSKTNEACGVKNAATRKYFTADHLWYFPPVDAFEQLVVYANKNGKSTDVPYFSVDGIRPLSGAEWEQMRSKFYCKVGVSNVWREPAVRGTERLKKGTKSLHSNQKPLKLMEVILQATSDQGDLVWEPFGGLCSAAVAARRMNRKCVSAEIDPTFYNLAVQRLEHDAWQPSLSE